MLRWGGFRGWGIQKSSTMEIPLVACGEMFLIFLEYYRDNKVYTTVDKPNFIKRKVF